MSVPPRNEAAARGYCASPGATSGARRILAKRRDRATARRRAISPARGAGQPRSRAL